MGCGFDLDDTLYSEDDYSQSGVAQLPKSLHGSLIWILLNSCCLFVKRREIFGGVPANCSLYRNLVRNLLWMYRLHQPQIDLGQEFMEVVAGISKEAQRFVILTDGRSTQRLKLDALNLLKYPSYISEEYHSNKPMIERFHMIMTDFPAANYVYVADNPVKDFMGPNSLGWKTIGVRNGGRNVHPQKVDDVSAEYLPNVWVDKLSDIVGNLC